MDEAHGVDGAAESSWHKILDSVFLQVLLQTDPLWTKAVYFMKDLHSCLILIVNVVQGGHERINKVRVPRGACCHGNPLDRRRFLRVASPRLDRVTAQMMTLEGSVAVGEDSEEGCPCVQSVW